VKNVQKISGNEEGNLIASALPHDKHGTAQQPEVVTLMSKTLTNIPGKEGLMITVEYAPGGADPVHRHNAQAFVYVLEGSVVMQVKG
jgi:quercetin dioxygenase-like cupin family protein